MSGTKTRKRKAEVMKGDAKDDEDLVIYSGEAKCVGVKGKGVSAVPCGATAYFLLGKLPMCGRHAPKKNTNRKKLRKNPKAKEHRAEAYRLHMAGVEEEASKNQQANRPGRVTMQKMRMMKTVPLQPGVWNVMPNFRHLNHPQGRGMPSLSPMSMGPIGSTARNLENAWQGSKVYADMIQGGMTDELTKVCNSVAESENTMFVLGKCDSVWNSITKQLASLPEPSAEWHSMSKAMKADPVPHRRQSDFLKGQNGQKDQKLPSKKQGNRAVYAVWPTSDSGLDHSTSVIIVINHICRWSVIISMTVAKYLEQEPTIGRYSYLQSREFYGQAYEWFARRSADFALLQRELARGVNICICGYDASDDIKEIRLKDGRKSTLDSWPEIQYWNPEQPFGHEKVLYCMLTIPDPANYPWRKAQTVNFFQSSLAMSD